MIICRRSGCNGTAPRCRSRNIETLQITRFRKVGCKNFWEFAGLQTAPASYRARNTANATLSCRMLQNAGFGTIPWGGEGGGGGSEPRTGIIYFGNHHVF